MLIEFFSVEYLISLFLHVKIPPVEKEIKGTSKIVDIVHNCHLQSNIEMRKFP